MIIINSESNFFWGHPVLLPTFCISGQGYKDGGFAHREYRFEGIYPNTVSSIPLDYGATDSLEEFQVTFNYIYWTVDQGNNIAS